MDFPFFAERVSSIDDHRANLHLNQQAAAKLHNRNCFDW